MTQQKDIVAPSHLSDVATDAYVDIPQKSPPWSFLCASLLFLPKSVVPLTVVISGTLILLFAWWGPLHMRNNNEEAFSNEPPNAGSNASKL